MPQRSSVVVLTIAMLAGLAPRAAPTDEQLILGRLVVVANPVPTDPARRRIKLVGREPSGSATIVGDPTVDGASLLVVVDDSQANASVFPLPAAGWSAVGTGFVYRDTAGISGPVRYAALRDSGRVFQVKALLLGRLGSVPIVPDGATEAGADLTVVGGDAYCMQWGGAAGGHVISRPADGSRLFKARKATSETRCASCGDRGAGTCGGYCPPTRICIPFVFTGSCGCQSIFGTTTTSTSTTTSTMPGSPGAAFLE